MRMACCLALAALLIPAAQANAQEQRALVIVVPDQNVGTLAEAGLHVAVASPAVDADAAGQTYLDVSQGARVSTRVYDDDLPRLHLEPDGQIFQWDVITERADDAPADLVPGLLGQTVRSTAYVGVRGRSRQRDRLCVQRREASGGRAAFLICPDARARRSHCREQREHGPDARDR